MATNMMNMLISNAITISICYYNYQNKQYYIWPQIIYFNKQWGMKMK